MDFSEVYKSSGKCSFSPEGNHLAHVFGSHLIILDTDFFHKLPDVINHIQWSKDSEYVLAVVRGRSFVRVFSRINSSYECRISNGVAGVTHALFTPDSRYILVMSDHNLRITIWSLTGPMTPIGVIKFPKFSMKGLSFKPDGKYMALAERRNCKDLIDIFVTDTWELVCQFPAQTKDLSDLSWSPNGRLIAVWDGPTEYKINIFVPDGSLLHTYSAYENALGIRSVRWCPNSLLLNVGSYDNTVRVLNKTTWRVLSELKHPKQVRMSSGCLVFNEVLYGGGMGLAGGIQINEENKTKYQIEELPVTLRKRKVDYDSANPRCGVKSMRWSHDGRYFYTKSEEIPNVLWIWQTGKLLLSAIIVQLSNIRMAAWDPKHTRLALCTGNGRIYMWSEDGCSCVELPNPGFRVQKLQWNQSGESMILIDHDKLVVCYPTWSEEDGGNDDGRGSQNMGVQRRERMDINDLDDEDDDNDQRLEVEEEDDDDDDDEEELEGEN